MNCPFCVKAKQLLNDMDVHYTYQEIDIQDKSVFLDRIANKTKNQRTYPLVFHGEEFIGGYSELEDYMAFFN